MVLVLRTPFCVLRCPWQKGQIGGLPLVIKITSMGRIRGLIYKGYDSVVDGEFDEDRYPVFIWKEAGFPAIPYSMLIAPLLQRRAVYMRSLHDYLLRIIDIYIYKFIFYIERLKNANTVLMAESNQQ